MRRRRKRNKLWPPPPLTEDQILGWADVVHELKGRWPRRDSGVVPGAWGGAVASRRALWRGAVNRLSSWIASLLRPDG